MNIRFLKVRGTLVNLSYVVSIRMETAADRYNFIVYAYLPDGKVVHLCSGNEAKCNKFIDDLAWWLKEGVSIIDVDLVGVS